ncbi:hypothetical protein KO527_23480 [Pseudoalteromonas sp. C2R02]|uniref:hypothetical protein n=1 Tax=Pseudoalteromonas sp. C2R02 TaxID=2841565 RepID=UPI001C0A3922|nr:hypothetical protein [Pseudoalteromonas sp. C2R02]MBU2972303.1 hypothetical protein [Pseudoalteromonas sp. C2R02]
MPNYRWLCLFCDRGNSEKVENCEFCGTNPTATGWEITAREFADKNILNKKESFSCEICSSGVHEVNYSEDPVEYFETRGKQPLFRTMFILTKCKGCEHQLKKEYSTPLLRKIYRFIFGHDIKSEYWKNK